MFTIKSAFVSYMIGLKRLSGVFSVLLGYFFFKEQHIEGRLIGASLMVIGAILISIG